MDSRHQASEIGLYGYWRETVKGLWSRHIPRSFEQIRPTQLSVLLLLQEKHPILDFQTGPLKILRVEIGRDENGGTPGKMDGTEGLGNKETVPAVQNPGPAGGGEIGKMGAPDTCPRVMRPGLMIPRGPRGPSTTWTAG